MCQEGKVQTLEEGKGQPAPMQTSWNLHWPLTVSSLDGEGDALERLVPKRCAENEMAAATGAVGLAAVPGLRDASAHLQPCVNSRHRALHCRSGPERNSAAASLCLPSPTQNASCGP